MPTRRERKAGPALRVSVLLILAGILFSSHGLIRGTAGDPSTAEPGSTVLSERLAASKGKGGSNGVAAPTFTQTPPDPSPTTTSTFAWTHPLTTVTFECQRENGVWEGCTSPLTYDVVVENNNETYQFSVRAVSGGKVSSAATYRWKLTNFEFGIAGSVSGLVPGALRPITLTITNPHNFPIYVVDLDTWVSSSPSGCPASTNIEFVPSPASSGNTIAVPANGSTVVDDEMRPQVRLINLNESQDACKNASFGLAYSGVATK